MFLNVRKMFGLLNKLAIIEKNNPASVSKYTYTHNIKSIHSRQGYKIQNYVYSNQEFRNRRKDLLSIHDSFIYSFINLFDLIYFRSTYIINTTDMPCCSTSVKHPTCSLFCHKFLWLTNSSTISFLPMDFRYWIAKKE